MSYPRKIISGGQTGADRGGLDAAYDLGFETGGYAPKNFRTELGPAPILGEKFNLIELTSKDYTDRTMANVRESDATIIFGDHTSRGSHTTIKFCIQFAKPYRILTYPHPVEDTDFHALGVFLWIKKVMPLILNVAGNRASKNKGIRDFTYRVMKRTLERCL